MLYLVLAILLFAAAASVITVALSRPVTVALAGNVSKEYTDIPTPRRLTVFDMFYAGNRLINPFRYEIFLIHGNSMEPAGYMDGNLVFVRRFKNPIEDVGSLKPGAVIVLTIEDSLSLHNGKPKIRRFLNTINDTDKIQTESHNENGVAYPSREHLRKNVIGEVVYQFSA